MWAGRCAGRDEMNWKYLALGVFAAVMLGASPRSGVAAAGAPPAAGDGDGPARAASVREVALQKCVLVKDVGNGKVTVKKKGNDRGESVRLTAGDRLVVCLDVRTAIAAKAQLHLRAHVDAGENTECDGEGGAGVALHVVADLAVEPGFGADAKLIASVFGQGRAGERVEVAQLTDLEPGLNNDPDDPNGLAPAAGAAADYCKTVDLRDTLPGSTPA